MLMSKIMVDDAMLLQVMERAWSIMAFISSALSDHPVVKSNRLYRRLTDRSRKALFDLHHDVEVELLGALPDRAAGKRRRSEVENAEDDFGAKFLRRKGTVPPDLQLGIEDNDPPMRKRRDRIRKRRP
jgi:hypothetical protein